MQLPTKELFEECTIKQKQEQLVTAGSTCLSGLWLFYVLEAQN